MRYTHTIYHTYIIYIHVCRIHVSYADATLETVDQLKDYKIRKH